MSKKYLKYRSDYLFARNSHVVGLGSIFNIFGRYHFINFSKSERAADAKAMRNDWRIVGQDIKKAMEKVK